MRLSFLILTLAIAAPAYAQVGPKKGASEKVVCRSLARTGSRVLGARICKSQAQWEADKSRVEEELLEAQREGALKDPGALPSPR